jgi:L-arabinose transport system permease protein
VTARRSLHPKAIARSLWQRAGMLALFAALFIVLSVFVPNFLSAVNLVNLALSVSTVGMVACTMLFCLVAGDFDLSVESIVACSGVIAAVVIAETGNVTLGIVAAILGGGLVGLFNGFVIAGLGINALIATLATMQIVRGVGFIICSGRPRPLMLPVLGEASPIGIPTPVWITAACFLLFGLLLNKTVFGRNALAIGGNPEAARLAGIAVTRTKMVIFTLQGLIAGAAGVIVGAKMQLAHPRPMEGFSLNVISACVLGSVSLGGGVGTITGALVGVLIMGTAENAMDLLNVEYFYKYVIRGSILLAAVLFDQFKRRRAARGT